MFNNREDTDRWLAMYPDGTVIDEDAGDRRRGWAEVDAARVALIQLREGDQIVASVLIPDDAAPVLFRRRTIAINVNSPSDAPEEAGRSTVTVIGYIYPDGAAVWLWRNPDGVVVMSQGEILE